jgi:hypothetical protein
MADDLEDAKAALERLRTLIVPGTGGVDAPELICLPPRCLADRGCRGTRKLAEALIGALTVLHFGSLLGGDLEAARLQAEKVLATIAMGQALAGSA